MSLQTLGKCIKKHGKAKTAVALGLKETSAINNWLSRKSIPVNQKENVKNLKNLEYIDVVRKPEIARI